MNRTSFAFSGVALAALAACSGGGGGAGGGYGAPPAPPSTAPGNATQQVITVALPDTAIGRVADPAFGLVGGYTQQTYSQVLGFVPGARVMIRNGDTGRPHTLGDTRAASFPATQPATLSTTATGSNAFAAGWQSGALAPGSEVGPVALSAGTYFIGCAFHYQSNGMRDVLVVAAAATPGPQATQAPGTATPAPGSSGGNNY